MNTNSRFAVAIHILTMLARSHPEPLTSVCMANSVTTNPVVLRRLLGDLRRAGLVESRPGNCGGWRLCKQPEQITLLDCYLAVKEGSLFGLPMQKPNPHCNVGKTITKALCGLFQDAEQALQERLAQTDLAQVVARLSKQQYCEQQNDAGIDIVPSEGNPSRGSEGFGMPEGLPLPRRRRVAKDNVL
jgi:Rrf2 family protein